ncbi:MAG: DNA alkylation repair protein [Candidatus Thiodiazotropha endolucinida]
MPELFRNYISDKSVNELAGRIETVFSKFESELFCRMILPFPEEMSLTDRLNLVSTTLDTFLPKEFDKATSILVDSLGPELDDQSDDPVSKEYESSNGFIVIALTEFISRNGIEHFDISMNALKEMTKRFSSEGSIRKFIVQHEEKTLKLYREWANDGNVHVRRLVSESTRPRLPWAQQLPRFIEDPRPVLALLELLKNDKHLYVRRSVANNLNDMAKDNPHLVIETLRRWKKDSSKEMTWLIKHALRTLEKQGNPEALELLGYSHEIDISVDSFLVKSDTISIGSELLFSLELSSKKKDTQKLLIDYVIYHQKANKTLTPKVFKWTKKTISSRKSLSISKKHLFKEITTRKYYAGAHEIHIQINGNDVAQLPFILKM